MTELNPCPCCGYRVFDEPPGSFEICPICFWEDDNLQLEFATTLDGGANGPTLLEAQRNFVRFGASDEVSRDSVRAPGPEDVRDPGWRPIDPTRDRFEDWADGEPARRLAEDAEPYYWRR